MRAFRRRVTILSAGGTFLDGFDLTVIAVALPGIIEQWHVTPGERSLIVVSAIVGSLVGATWLGRLTDRFGRKAMYVFDLLGFVVFAVLTALSQNVWQLVLTRFLLGVAIGADYPISATLVSEFASRKSRGKHGTSLAAMWFVGAVFSYIVGLLVIPLGDLGWRALLFVGAIFALVVFIFRIKLPESPRWLIAHGREQEAVEVMRKASGDPTITLDVVTQQADDVAGLGVMKLSSLMAGRLRRNLMFVCGFWFCYATAYYGISMYTPTILTPFTEGSQTLTVIGAGIVALLGLLGSVIGMQLVDRWGRRPLIITSFGGLTVALVVLALVTNPTLVFLIALFSVAVLFANSGGGILNFVYPSELFPTEARAAAAGIATSVSRMGSILGVLLFPNVVAWWGTNHALWLFAAVGLAGLIICVGMAPETRGRSLEEINAPIAAR